MAEEADAHYVDRGPSVVVVLVDDGAVVLVQQWREAVGAETVELVQERLEPGESALDAAIRGVREECALRATRWREHGSFWAVPAYSTQRAHVLSAVVDGRVPGSAGGETKVVHCDPADLDVLLDDAVSLAGLALYRRSAASASASVLSR
jgi:8-oxo-dGTP pyrophosphatase MutT (NUDIX family)